MSTTTPTSIDHHRNSNGDFDHPGSTNAGVGESNANHQLTPQLQDESTASFTTRSNAYHWANANKSGT